VTIVRVPAESLKDKDKSMSNDEKPYKSKIYAAFLISIKPSQRQENANFGHFFVTDLLQKNQSCFSVTNYFISL